MGVIIRIFAIVFLVFCAEQVAFAQDYPKRTIDGEEYYVYKVEPGNTLFAIARTFSVSVTELSAVNSNATDGLSIGEEVLVPISAINKRQARKSDIALDGEFLLHTVQKRETLFSLSKKYGVDINLLIAKNPEAESGLKRGTVLRIPIVKSTAADERFVEPAQNDSLVVHQVEEGQTLYSISKQYDVSVDSLQAINHASVNNLKPGDWLVIPVYSPSYIEQREIREKLSQEARKAEKYESVRKDVYKLGLMLPFEFSLNDSLEKNLHSGKSLFVLTEIALDYYRGAQIALDSLKKMGLNAEVFVYDVGEDLVRSRETVKRDEFSELDLIFGPLHKSSLAVISDASKKSETYLVSPNSFANEVFEDNPYLLRAMASEETMMRYLANYVAIHHQKHNVYMVNSEGPKDWPYRKLFKENYNKAIGTFPNAIHDSIRSITKEFINPEKAGDWLRKDTPNVVVVPSNQLAFVSDFMTRLSRLDEEYQIRVYGLDNWVKYENIESNYKNRFGLRIVAPQFLNFDDEQLIFFLEEYRNRYGMEPTSHGYGYLGFDLMMYFGTALMNYGTGFPIKFGEMEMEGVSSNFRFGKSTTGKEFENKSVFILEYDDFELKRIN
ncbi:MAG TPA: LysM peptidoglycan-binding domain-containing protein [Cryomorphaceae bacterium]|nr:LysM peptidoglycan-binding domain-containing protein [Cryomorphaceae bacterium]